MAKVCKGCKEVIPSHKEKTNIYCSRSCANRRNNLGVIRNGKKHSCQSCGIRVPWRKRYCSKKCRNLSITKRHINETLMKMQNGNQISPGGVRKAMLYTHGEHCMDKNCVWDFSERPVIVEVDHIDGDRSNNHPNNLRLLCPNCHSLTPTYKAKNRKKFGTPIRIRTEINGL